jgi:hypothetical protein
MSASAPPPTITGCFLRPPTEADALFIQKFVARSLCNVGNGWELFQERVHPEKGRKKQDAAIAILDIGRMNDGVQQQTQRVYENMALLALDLFARVIAMRIDAAPPFSALFTLWLSTMAAVGLASRSPCSRHAT